MSQYSSYDPWLEYREAKKRKRKNNSDSNQEFDFNDRRQRSQNDSRYKEKNSQSNYHQEAHYENDKYLECYQFLGLDCKATLEDVKKAYKEKIKKVHPDLGGDPEEARKLIEMYEQLIAYLNQANS